MLINDFIIRINSLIWSFPFLLIIFLICFFMTLILRFVQLKYFFYSLRKVFLADKSDKTTKNEGLTSFQAFLNTLSANIGNGSLTGIPVALCSGGPGTLFWLGVMSFFAMALRYSEVYLSKHFIGKVKNPIAHGGPMLYLSLLPGGKILPYFFAFFCLLYTFLCGNLIQCNAIGVAIFKSWNIKPPITAVFVCLFMIYALTGGVTRIIKILEKLVPFKVGLFFFSACVVLIYYSAAIPSAILLILKCAFNSKAVCGGAVIYALQEAISIGFRRGILLHESGLGTAAISYGTGSSKNSAQDGIISTLAVYISVYIVCFMLGLVLISSGVWNNGETSAALIITAYQTVFGSFASWIVTFLIINFAVSLVVSYSFIGKVCWEFLFKKKFSILYLVLYIATTFLGTFVDVNFAWAAGDLATAFLFIVNVIGICAFAKTLKNGLSEFESSNKA